MANIWTLKFGIEEKLPILVRSGTNVGSNISFLSNRIYKDLKGPSDPIDVNNDFTWTKSPKSSRQDVPTLRLIEKRITKNSTVSNLAYSLLATADLANTVSVQGAASIDLLAGNEEANVQNSLQNLKSGAADSVNSIVNNSETLTKVKGKINEILDFEAFQSNVLKAYNYLYITEKTGFEYIFPYLEDDYRESNLQMGENQQNVASSLLGGAADLAQQAAGLALVLRPGVYIEEAQQFSMGQEGRTLNIKIPLLNTGNYEDILKNWQLVFGLVYQNRPGRITKNLVDVPVIYEAFIEGMAYMPYAYIKGLSVSFLGNRRTMKMKIPVTKFTSQGSDVGIQTREITTVVPDAYQLNLSITGLNEETRNFMYESIDPGLVTSKVSVGNDPNFNDETSSATDSSELSDQSTRFSSRSFPGRTSVRNKNEVPTEPRPKIQRRNN
tara:strand:+ start:5954 stop:7273 length:1320 start_codon:yes stop_codon:yes gene_type:complete